MVPWNNSPIEKKQREPVSIFKFSTKAEKLKKQRLATIKATANVTAKLGTIKKENEKKSLERT